MPEVRRCGVQAATQNAHHIWYVFVGIGAISAVALFIYGRVTKKLDEKKARASACFPIF